MYHQIAEQTGVEIKADNYDELKQCDELSSDGWLGIQNATHDFVYFSDMVKATIETKD